MTGKVWFITGSSRGLGRCFVATYGDVVLPIAMDVTDKAAVFEGVKRLPSTSAGVEPGGFATRDGKNPDPFANGHLAEPSPAYDGLRRRLAGVMGGQPAGDPEAAAQALLKVVDSANPPLRVLFGQVFYPLVQRAYADRLKTWADWQELSVAAQGNAGPGGQ